ncbi:MAG: serine/threonine-protein kinase [Burkholderiales bacterium]
MTSQLYFDTDELRKGNFFNLNGEIRTEEGQLYELEDWIGRGGNASVFKGRQRITGEECAIKFLINPRVRNTKRFLREVKLLQSMRGDHITRYHGTGRVIVRHNRATKDNALPFVVMELADCNLQEKMRAEQNPISYEQYAGQFRGLASALASLHDKAEAVHRDIKPENILVVGERWLLSDYGLCTIVSRDEEDLTPEAGNLGPKFWLSPEAHNRRIGCGDVICAASDVFQLAAIFWYVATGRHPCGIVTRDDWTGPEKLFHCLHRSLFHDVSKRPQNGGVFFTELEEALSQ